MKQTAFTLIELLVVIVIIGILATVSTATYQGVIDKGHQGKSYALQNQINTLITGDCLSNGYECGENIVPNWAFSEGDTGDWVLGSHYDIFNYKLRHQNRANGSSSLDFITVPVNEPFVLGDTYRVDVVARKVDFGSVSTSPRMGFSGSGGVSGYSYSEDNQHICDVFANAVVFGTNNVRLFVRAGVDVEFDEVSIRKVIGGDFDVDANDDCTLDFDQAI